MSVPVTLEFLCFQASILNNMLLQLVGATTDRERVRLAECVEDQIVVVLAHATEYRAALGRLVPAKQSGNGVEMGPVTPAFLLFPALIVSNMLLRSVGACSDRERGQIAGGLEDHIIVLLVHASEYRNTLGRPTSAAPGEGVGKQ